MSNTLAELLKPQHTEHWGNTYDFKPELIRKVYGDGDPALAASLSGFVLAGENASNTGITGAASCTRTAGETVAGSSYTITCVPNTLASPNYDFTTGTTAAFDITRRPVTVTADAKTKEYGSPDPTLTFTTTSLGTGVAINGSLTRAAGETVAGSPYAIQQGTVTNAGNANYTITYVGANLSITKAPLTVNAVTASKTFGQADPAFTWTLSGFKFSDNATNSGITGAASCTRNAGEDVSGSPYTITCTPGDLTAPNYNFQTGTAANFTISPSGTTTTITNTGALSNLSPVNEPYAVNFTVAPVSPGVGVPTGTVTVSDAAGGSCQAVLTLASAGSGSCQLTSTSVGAKTITASYAPDTPPGNFAASVSQSVAHTIVIVIRGNVKQFVRGGTNTNLSGVTIRLSGSVSSEGTTDASGNYIFAVFNSGGSFVITPSGLSKVYEPITRTYTNVTNNIPNADFLAYETTGGANSVPRVVRAVNTTATPGTPVEMPVEVISQGNETRFEFTLVADASVVGVPIVECGTQTPNCNISINTTQPGRTGIRISNFGTLAQGIRQIATVTYPTTATSQPNIQVSFADLPVARDIRNTENDPLPAIYQTGFISFDTSGTGLEGDVADGNGASTGGDGVRANDVTLMRAFALRLATPNETNGQFQKADAAPRDPAGGIFGDGQINAADVTVARQYAVGILPPTNAAGPSTNIPLTTMPDALRDRNTEDIEAKEKDQREQQQPEEQQQEQQRQEAAGRTLRVQPAKETTNATAAATAAKAAKAERGERISMEIELDSMGNEASLGFTLKYDAAAMKLTDIKLGEGVPTGTNLATNTTRAEEGQIGILLDAAQRYEKGPRTVLILTFEISTTAPDGHYPITLSDDLLQRSISSDSGDLVDSAYINGVVVLRN